VPRSAAGHPARRRKGSPEWQSATAGPLATRLAGVLPRVSQMLPRAYAPGRRPCPSTSADAASQEMGRPGWRTCSPRRGSARARRSSTAANTGRPRAVQLPRGEGQFDARARRARGHRPERLVTRTRTPSPTCRCCGRPASRSSSTPNADLRRNAIEEAGEVLHLDRARTPLEGARAFAAAPLRRRRPRGEGHVGARSDSARIAEEQMPAETPLKRSAWSWLSPASTGTIGREDIARALRRRRAWR